MGSRKMLGVMLGVIVVITVVIMLQQQNQQLVWSWGSMKRSNLNLFLIRIMTTSIFRPKITLYYIYNIVFVVLDALTD